MKSCHQCGINSVPYDWFCCTSCNKNWDGKDYSGVTAPVKFDSVSKPEHYAAGAIECIEVIEQQGFGYNIGCVQKYIWRAGKKTEDRKTDLEKALWFLKRELALIEGNAPKPKDMK